MRLFVPRSTRTSLTKRVMNVLLSDKTLYKWKTQFRNLSMKIHNFELVQITTWLTGLHIFQTLTMANGGWVMGKLFQLLSYHFELDLKNPLINWSTYGFPLNKELKYLSRLQSISLNFNTKPDFSCVIREMTKTISTRKM
jgi:hypothetical protein